MIGIASLEQDPDGNSDPTVAKALKEVFQIRKPGGVLTITSITPSSSRQTGSLS